MRTFKIILCGLFFRHNRLRFIKDTHPGADDAYYRCDRCGATWDYYF